jgi:hypothetical protein
MSGTHGVFQHRTGYFYTLLEEDFCEMYKAEGVNEVCRAYITSILENLTNKQFDGSGNNEEIWVYISLPEMARRMRNACSERTIHKEIQGMIKDGYLKKRRATNKATMEYCLNLKKIREGLASLPEKQSCNSARTDLAELQDQSGKFARSTLQNCKNDLAELQPRISNRLNKEESIATDVLATEPLAPDVALPTTQDNRSVEQQSFMPEEKPKSSSKKKQRDTEPLPKKVPEMPPPDMQWGTNKCLLMFDALRGHTLIAKHQLMNASSCAKGLAEQFTEDEVLRVYQSMCEDAYWQERGGPDICNVASNIHRELKKAKPREVVQAPKKPKITREYLDSLPL